MCAWIRVILRSLLILINFLGFYISLWAAEVQTMLGSRRSLMQSLRSITAVGPLAGRYTSVPSVCLAEGTETEQKPGVWGSVYWLKLMHSFVPVCCHAVSSHHLASHCPSHPQPACVSLASYQWYGNAGQVFRKEMQQLTLTVWPPKQRNRMECFPLSTFPFSNCECTVHNTEELTHYFHKLWWIIYISY